MKRYALWILTVLLLTRGGAAAEPTTLELLGVDTVDGLLIADIDADGADDVLILEGRDLSVWRGRKNAAPAPDATWKRTLPAGVSFVDAMHTRRPAVLTVGTDAVAVIALDGEAAPIRQPGYESRLRWRDAEGAVFADLVRARPRAAWLLPHDGGWEYEPDGAGGPIQLALAPHRHVSSRGPFLEDTCTVVDALPSIFVGVGAPAGAKDAALWALDGRTLVSQSAGQRVTYDLAFLSAAGGGDFDQTLVDLDGDDRPDLMHRIGTNREARYGFFRTRPAAKDSKTGPSHKPAVGTLSLSGFQLPPELVDLDGDGLKDLIVTSMQVNAANMLGALTSGRVTAETRAFLNRWKRDGTTFFDAEPDAVIKSQIGVKVQFNYAGNVEVIRSFTILVNGDFDGDGRCDLAIRTAPDTLTIRRGTKDGVWAGDDESHTLKIPPQGASPDIDGYVADTDGDGKDEIVLLYRKPPGGKDRVRVVDPGS